MITSNLRLDLFKTLEVWDEGGARAQSRDPFWEGAFCLSGWPSWPLRGPWAPKDAKNKYAAGGFSKFSEPSAPGLANEYSRADH